MVANTVEIRFQLLTAKASDGVVWYKIKTGFDFRHKVLKWWR